jgi:hypothetical protein
VFRKTEKAAMGICQADTDRPACQRHVIQPLAAPASSDIRVFRSSLAREIAGTCPVERGQ